MATVKSWIKAARLRTLPLALSGIIIGSGVAALYHVFSGLVCVLAVLTATALQVLSNFANDYGDFRKGTDNDARLGPTRTMQGGEITVKEMKQGIGLAILISFLFGMALIIASQISWQAVLIFIGLGLCCVLAAYYYTAGEKSYGYVGLGDVSVFVFFGLVAVSALYYLYAHYFNVQTLLPAISVGCFATGVLNLNNMRDRQNDMQSGKITVASRLGASGAKFYHLILILVGWITILLFAAFNFTSYRAYLFILAAPFFIKDLVQIFQTEDEANLDPFLKKLSLATLLFSVLFTIGVVFELSNC